MKTQIATCCLLLLLSCKKKEEPAPTPTPAPTPAKIIAVKVNGAEKSCSTGRCWSSNESGGIGGIYFYLAGFDEEIYLGYFNLPTVGTYSLVNNGQPNLQYIKNNINYRAVNGSIHITQIDTSSSG